MDYVFSFFPFTSVSESVQSANEVQQDAKAEATKPNVATSVFVNSEPMREEQVQNAVKFLSHPKVRGSPVMYRRSFLERKGLTKEEIDEAFRRVPVSKLLTWVHYSSRTMPFTCVIVSIYSKFTHVYFLLYPQPFM